MPELKLNPKQSLAFQTTASEVFYGGQAGGGKLTPLTTNLAQPYGFVRMGDVKIGDILLDKDGNPCRVTAISEIEQTPELWEFEFDDGETVISCVDHQWLTYDAKELLELTCRTDEWRAKRREKRKSRAGTNKPEAFRQAVSVSNAEVAKAAIKPEPEGSVRTTREIVETLRTKSGRANHAIPVCKCLELPEADLPLDPYVLGCWLGGGSRWDGSIAGIDDEVWELIEARGYTIHHHKNVVVHYVQGILGTLKKINVYKNKHIPRIYLRASKEQRLELLRGLMDTDGTVTRNSGSAEFCHTNETLIDDVQELICSLGWKVRKRGGIAKLNGRTVGPKWTLKFVASEYVFNLARKRNLQKLATRRTCKFRYIIDARPAPTEPGRCITVDSPSRTYLIGRTFIPTHNTFLNKILAISVCLEVPNAQVLIMRETSPQLQKNYFQGDNSFQDILKPFIDASMCRIYFSPPMSISFHNGSKISFMHCEHVPTALNNLQGIEYSLIIADEATHIDEQVLRYAKSRLRRSVKIENEFWAARLPRLQLTSNPGGRSHKFVKEEYIAPSPPMVEFKNAQGGTSIFIPASVQDNEHIDAEAYDRMLRGLGDPVLYAQLAEGSWDAGTHHYFSDVFKRQFNVVPNFEIPSDWTLERGFDKGYSSPFGYVLIARVKGQNLVTFNDGTQKYFPNGSIIIVKEWYGCNPDKRSQGLRLSPEEIAEAIREKEKEWGYHQRIKPGRADNNLWNAETNDADKMAKYGIRFKPADKRKGSRSFGAIKMRRMFAAAHVVPTEQPALYFMESCIHCIDTIPSLPTDPDNPDDVVTEGVEDHLYDAVRYNVATDVKTISTAKVYGL